MLLDLDYFFAQCEELRSPDIRDKPVVVGVYSGRSEDSGAVSTANYIARHFGVRSGMPIFQAKRKLANANAVFLPVDYDYYESISGKVMQILRTHGDSFEQVGIDEAYVEVTKMVQGSYEVGRKLAQKIKDTVLNEQKLTCSIGVGPNKLLAKIAADIEKPNGLTVVKPENARMFLAPMSVNRIIGVGHKTSERMQALRIRTIDDLSKYDIQKLATVFGKTAATYFHNASLGIDDEPVHERGEATSVSRISTLKQDSREVSLILEATDKLCKDIYLLLKSEDLSFKTVGIIVVGNDMSSHSLSKTLEYPNKSTETMKEIVKELLEKFLDRYEVSARRVGVKVSNFVREQKNQSQITSFIET
jgi:DNA polymerase IV (DinB-like DNA polymerase)